jgi:serine/threonine-protein kinase
MSGARVKEGDVIAGKFRIDRIIGEGGMGIVAAATRLDLDQPVAIKVMRMGSSASTARERFVREARAAAKLTTQHVARVFDVGTTESGEPYMAMELLEGRDLAAELAARGPLPIPEAVGYILQAIEGVAEAHAAGIVHRDIKPANMFLARGKGGDICVKVVDFGISKMVGGSLALTQEQTPIGSPLYMSPEQMHNSRDVDGRADVWSLAVSLYELLTTKTPFDCEDMHDLQSRIYRKDPPPLATYRSDVPAGFESVLLTCMAKDREKRWPNVAGLAAALVPFGPPGAEASAARAAVMLGEKLEPARATMDLGSSAVPARSGAGTSGALVSGSGAGTGAGRPGLGTAEVIAIGAAMIVAVGAAGIGIGRWQSRPEPVQPSVGSAVVQAPATSTAATATSTVDAPSVVPVAPAPPATVAPDAGATSAAAPVKPAVGAKPRAPAPKAAPGGEPKAAPATKPSATLYDNQ